LIRQALRAAAWTVAAVLAIAALRRDPIDERKPAELLDATRASSSSVRRDSVARGETLADALGRAGLDRAEVAAALAAATALDPRRIPAGMAVTARGPRGGPPERVTLELAVDRLLHLTRGPDGWTADEERLPWQVDTVGIRGVVRNTLYDAVDVGSAEVLPRGARAELAWAVADVFEYRVDMSRDLQPGDSVRVLVERAQGPRGAVRVGAVLAAGLTAGRTALTAIRWGEGREATFYDDSGRSLRAQFLRAPLQFRRISSVFGRRLHPILKTWRAHRGTDYAASAGTPVRAIGAGVVVAAHRGAGYGNLVDIRHANGMVSRYAHLSRFGPGVRRGTRVTMGETIGYVGMTGLATAPHLHFEILVNGQQRDPRTVLRGEPGAPIPPTARPAFAAHRDHLLGRLAAAVTPTAAAP
jgi:murein DD-endopeptidase MepM/ murein hydrolase activator NlpD